MGEESDSSKWAILPEQHREILRLLRLGFSVRKTAEIVGVGHRTVQRRRARLMLEFEAEAEDELECEEGEALIKFRDVSGRCEVHGPINVQPCVLCTALAAKGKKEKGGTP